MADVDRDPDSMLTRVARLLRHGVSALQDIAVDERIVGVPDQVDASPAASIASVPHDRIEAVLSAMNGDERPVAQRLLRNAPDELRREWIAAAIASDIDITTARRFAQRLNMMRPEAVAYLDPTRYTDPGAGAQRLLQPDCRTCGSSTLVAAKMINAPVYALAIMTGYNARTGRDDVPVSTRPIATVSPSADSPQARFSAAALAIHRTTNTFAVPGSTFRIPYYPKIAGTPPPGIAREMSRPGGSGVPHTAYRFDVADPYHLNRMYESVCAAVRSRYAAPLYLGDARYPRHIVLVTGVREDSVHAYAPSSGQMTTITRAQFTNNGLPFGALAVVWGAVLPRPRIADDV